VFKNISAYHRYNVLLLEVTCLKSVSDFLFRSYRVDLIRRHLDAGANIKVARSVVLCVCVCAQASEAASFRLPTSCLTMNYQNQWKQHWKTVFSSIKIFQQIWKQKSSRKNNLEGWKGLLKVFESMDSTGVEEATKKIKNCYHDQQDVFFGIRNPAGRPTAMFSCRTSCQDGLNTRILQEFPAVPDKYPK
jgi:hypothetical protein